MHIEVLKYFVKQITCKNEGMSIINTCMSHIQQNLILPK